MEKGKKEPIGLDGKRKAKGIGRQQNFTRGFKGYKGEVGGMKRERAREHRKGQKTGGGKEKVAVRLECP